MTRTGAQQPELDQATLDEGLASLRANEARVYYDSAADAVAATGYYRDIDPDVDGATVLAALHTLVSRTHTNRPRYAPARMLYPWVDLHPDRQLRSVYSGKTFGPEDFIRDDARIARERTRRLQQLAAPGLDDLASVEEQMPFNCEHVVPQSSFARAEPMRGDLHHLFACEVRCNSFRSNTPYFDFPDFDRVVRHDCGRSEPQRFEPNEGKGAVARATLYFLIRYPDVIGDQAHELQADRLPILLDWHEAEPAGQWERHRNAAVAEIQGNRNPMIDHAEWARLLPFATAFGN